MRSFSKKLAFVLAAAMVVTAFAPAASAKAADEMAINKSEQILYVNEGINHKGGEVAAPGKGNVSVYDFNLKNKPADWKTAYSFAWSSSDENVVTVAKGGVATAVAVGKATVYCKVTEKATNEVTTLKTKVTVKANAYDVEISNADAWDGATVEVNDVVDLNRTMYDEDGNPTTKRGTLVTDYTKWVAEPATGVEINQKNGQFTFTDAAEAGEYKLYCYTYQSSKYTEKTAEADPIVVELVKDSTFAVTQNSATKVTLTLSSALKSLPVADVTVNRMVGDYAYAQVVRAAVLSEDGKTATVELFGAFIDGATYEVGVKGFETVSFVASVGAPATMVVVASGKTPANVLTTGETATLQCLFYDANGVDVTSAEYEQLVTYKLEKSATQGEFILNGKKLTIKKDSAFATVIANYRGKFENGKIVGALEAKETFYAVDAPAIYPVGVNVVDLDGNWYDAVTTTLQVSEDKNVWLKVALSNGEEAEFTTFANKNNEAQFTANNNGLNERITITPVTPEVADIVNGVVLPNKAGTAVFYVNYGIKTNGTWSDVPFATIEVTVIEDAYLNSISIANSSFTVSASDIYLVGEEQISSNDFFYVANADAPLWQIANNITKRVGFSQNANNILGYDQRGNRIAVTTNTATIKCLSDGYGEGYDAADLSAWPYVSTWFDPSQGYWADGVNYVGLTIDGAMIKHYLVSKGLFDAADNGQYISLDYEVTCKAANGADIKAYFTVTVQEPTAGADNEYIEVKASSNYVDISRYVTPYDWNNNTESGKTLSFEVFKKSNGVTVDTVAIAPYDKNTATVGAYQYKILKDGQEITASANVYGDKTSDYPYSVAPELVNTNKAVVRLTGQSEDSKLYTALGVTSGAFVPNYYDKGTGLYTFALFQWFVDDAGELYAVQLHQSDANVVMNGTGAYSIDKNAQLKNTVTISGDYAVDSVAILKSFTFKNRDGKNVLKTDDGVNYYFDGDYKYFVDYTATANYVYVKEVVFYESLGDGCYAPYTVSVDTSLVRK